jgi:hypothetical protein
VLHTHVIGAGFYDESDMCLGNGTVNPSDTPNEGGYYSGDWKALNDTTAWIRQKGEAQALAVKKGQAKIPFFAYQGMDIVHPAYFTNQ